MKIDHEPSTTEKLWHRTRRDPELRRLLSVSIFLAWQIFPARQCFGLRIIGKDPKAAVPVSLLLDLCDEVELGLESCGSGDQDTAKHYERLLKRAYSYVPDGY
jgi:hypothetical protein